MTTVARNFSKAFFTVSSQKRHITSHMLLARASHMAPPNCKGIQKYKLPYTQESKGDQ